MTRPLFMKKTAKQKLLQVGQQQFFFLEGGRGFEKTTREKDFMIYKFNHVKWIIDLYDHNTDSFNHKTNSKRS